MNDNFPPRGSGIRGRSEHLPMQSWASGVQLGAGWSYRPGSILIGVDENGREIGFNDDRHAIMFAGTGGGKTSTLLKYNYERWPGSMIVTDPKGELWAAGHKKREDEAAGRKAYKFDPFGVTEGASHCYNPLAELGFGNAAMMAADAALIADALIIAHKGGDPHWTDSAQNLIKGFILLMHLQGNPTLRRLRQMLHSTPAQLSRLLDEMVESDAYGGVLANIGAAFMGKQVGSERELAGILSTAQEQTAPLDEIADITDRSDFSMADLRDGKITLNVILPGMRLLTHARAMRLLVQMSLAALERYPVPRGGTPVLFMLEELAALGPMRSVESAAGLMRGYPAPPPHSCRGGEYGKLSSRLSRDPWRAPSPRRP